VILGLALASVPLPDELRTAALLFAPLAIVGFVGLVVLASQRERTLRIVMRLLERAAFLRRWNVLSWVEHFLDGLMPLTQPSALLRVSLLAGQAGAVPCFPATS
jgi:hypothetical protein